MVNYIILIKHTDYYNTLYDNMILLYNHPGQFLFSKKKFLHNFKKVGIVSIMMILSILLVLITM